MIELHPDFREFLNFLNVHGVEYLLVGGYAVGRHGYPRATGDLDVWIPVNDDTATKMVAVLCDFGFPAELLSEDLFLDPSKIIRMGVPPVRIEVLTGVSGVVFADCYSRRDIVDLEGLRVNVISLSDLKTNKLAAGRHKDLEDLEHLE